MPVFAQLGDAALTTLPALTFHLLLAFVLAKPLAWVYVWTHHGTSYSRSFVHALVLLSLIVTLVMLAVGDSVARAFGLFGALALIRFRTPIKDSRDTMFLFLSVAIGITTGAQNLTLAVAGTLLTLAIAVYLYGIRFGARLAHDGVLRFARPAQGAEESRLRQVLAHYCHRCSLVSLREARQPDAVEVSYHVSLHEADAQQAFVTDLRAIPGVSDVFLLVSSEQEEL